MQQLSANTVRAGESTMGRYAGTIVRMLGGISCKLQWWSQSLSGSRARASHSIVMCYTSYPIRQKCIILSVIPAVRSGTMGRYAATIVRMLGGISCKLQWWSQSLRTTNARPKNVSYISAKFFAPSSPQP